MKMTKIFEHGPLRATVQAEKVNYSSLSELPTLVIHYDSVGNRTAKYRGMYMHVPAEVTQQEIHRLLESPALESELMKFVNTELGIEGVRFFPTPNGLKFQLSNPDFKLGELCAGQMKIFAKMSLSSLFTVRMYRPARRNELLGTMGIFGTWSCNGENGVFSIDGPGPNFHDVCVGDASKIALELSAEFKARWPIYPDVTFEVLDYDQVRPFLNPAEK
jgi:hypothetical protein